MIKEIQILFEFLVYKYCNGSTHNSRGIYH